jgi:hypothetical protein
MDNILTRSGGSAASGPSSPATSSPSSPATSSPSSQATSSPSSPATSGYIVLPITYLLDFYHQNKDMIYMSPKEIGEYSPNIENIDQWIENIRTHQQYRKTCKERISEINKKTPAEYTEDESANLIEKLINNEYCDDTDHTDIYLAFAKAFKNILRYIPFDEMMEKINKIALEINSLKERNNYNKIYFFIDDVVKKSNTWIALLLIGELLKTSFFLDTSKKGVLNKSFVVGNTDIIYSDIESLKNNENILVLHIDDMSYSGTQILFNLNSKYINNKYPNLHWYITVGYIGESALRNFDSYNIKYKLFEATEVIGTFINLAKDFITKEIMEKINLEKRKNTGLSSDLKKHLIKAMAIVRAISDLCSNNPNKTLKKGYGYGEGAFYCRGDQQILIYFDHKIADTVSTFQKLLITGGWPTSPDHCSDLPLINNCDVKVASYRGKGCYIPANTDIPDQETCPYTFYKRPGFIYQYNGEQIIPNNHINEELIRIYNKENINIKETQQKINELSNLPKPTRKGIPAIQYMKALQEWNIQLRKGSELKIKLEELEKINFFDSTWIQKREEFIRNDKMISEKIGSVELSKISNVNSKSADQEAGGSIYKKIINPVTGRKVRIESKLGMKILKNYLKYLNKT